MAPINARNANPLNLRPGQPYEGLASQAGGFCVFQSPVWGFRAAFRNYITKFDRGVNTVAKLIAEWAPPGDHNDTAAYIKAVCDKTGFGADEVIALKSWDVASKVCYAQTEVETGATFETYWTQKQMAEGAFRAGIVDAPPPVASKIASTIASSGAGVAAAAATVQASVDAANTQQHSHVTTIALTVISAALAIAGAILRAKAKTEG